MSKRVRTTLVAKQQQQPPLPLGRRARALPSAIECHILTWLALPDWTALLDCSTATRALVERYLGGATRLLLHVDDFGLAQCRRVLSTIAQHTRHLQTLRVVTALHTDVHAVHAWGVEHQAWLARLVADNHASLRAIECDDSTVAWTTAEGMLAALARCTELRTGSFDFASNHLAPAPPATATKFVEVLQRCTKLRRLAVTTTTQHHHLTLLPRALTTDIARHLHQLTYTGVVALPVVKQLATQCPALETLGLHLLPPTKFDGGGGGSSASAAWRVVRHVRDLVNEIGRQCAQLPDLEAVTVRLDDDWPFLSDPGVMASHHDAHALDTWLLPRTVRTCDLQLLLVAVPCVHADNLEEVRVTLAGSALASTPWWPWHVVTRGTTNSLKRIELGADLATATTRPLLSAADPAPPAGHLAQLARFATTLEVLCLPHMVLALTAATTSDTLARLTRLTSLDVCLDGATPVAAVTALLARLPQLERVVVGAGAVAQQQPATVATTSTSSRCHPTPPQQQPPQPAEHKIVATAQPRQVVLPRLRTANLSFADDTLFDRLAMPVLEELMLSPATALTTTTTLSPPTTVHIHRLERVLCRLPLLARLTCVAPRVTFHDTALVCQLPALHVVRLACGTATGAGAAASTAAGLAWLARSAPHLRELSVEQLPTDQALLALAHTKMPDLVGLCLWGGPPNTTTAVPVLDATALVSLADNCPRLAALRVNLGRQARLGGTVLSADSRAAIVERYQRTQKPVPVCLAPFVL